MADGDFPASHSVKAYVAVIAENVKLKKALETAVAERDEALETNRILLKAAATSGVMSMRADVDQRRILEQLLKEREAAEQACKALLEKLDRLDKRVETVVAERGEARAVAGKLAEQVVELTGKLVVADIENGRLREALEFYAATETWTDFRSGYSDDRVTVLLPEGLTVINGKRAREALEPKEVARVAVSTEGADDGRAD